MVKFSAYAVATALGALASVTDASQDNNHYPGFTNPNLSDPLYYADAVNVLQDIELGKFEKLYIKYKSCVWSEYGLGGENNQNNNGGDGSSANCGSGNGGDEHWYMGRTACFRANAAFELYGVLAGSSDSGCEKSTFINTFFTRTGPEVLGDSFGLDNTYVNVGCTIGNGAGDDAAGDDGWGNNENSHNVLANSKEVSYATGCSPQGQFRLDSFQGSYCDGLHYQETITSPTSGDVATYNSAMEALSCSAIYDATEGTDLASVILAYSAACSVTEFPGVCSDPYGKIARRAKQLASAASTAHQQHLKSATYNPIKHSTASKSVGAKVMNGLSAVMLLAGLYLFASACFGGRKGKTTEDEPSDEASVSLPIVREISRTVSHISQQVVDKIQTYAEEEEPVVDYGFDEPTVTTDVVSSPSATPVAAPVAEIATQPKMKKKRPRLAKLSKKLFGSKRK